ncbi:MAG: chemotaxis protein CheW [Gemmatimonadetes bacterium]|nr:chemotaxis protein CheW [Gemmatimonadota bacterium]
MVCRVGDRRLALGTDAVREVCTGLNVAPMPGVAAPVEGVVNLRGTLITVVRADVLLDGPGKRPSFRQSRSVGGLPSGEAISLPRLETTATTWCSAATS